jgi:hypothetical protein
MRPSRTVMLLFLSCPVVGIGVTAACAGPPAPEQQSKSSPGATSQITVEDPAHSKDASSKDATRGALARSSETTQSSRLPEPTGSTQRETSAGTTQTLAEFRAMTEGEQRQLLERLVNNVITNLSRPRI